MSNQDYTLLRPSKNCRFYRYRLKSDLTRTARTTKCIKKYEAIDFVQRIIKQKQNNLPTSFGDYSSKFFLEDSCPYVLERKCANQNISSSWIKARRGQLKNHILPKFKHFQLTDLDYSVVNPWISTVSGSYRLKNEILRTLTIILNYAKRDGLIQDHKKYNFLKFAKKNSNKRTTLTISQINSLFPKNNKELLKIWEGNFDLATLSYVMATTGIRTGEGRAIRWSDIYWDEMGLIICHTISNDNKLEPTKTRKNYELNSPDRVLPLVPRAISMLHELRKQSENNRIDDFVFSGKRTRKWIGKTFLNKKFKGIMVKNLSNSTITPYSLRHSFKQIFAVLLGELQTETLLGHSLGSVSDTYNEASQCMLLQRLQHLKPCRDIIEKELG